MKLGQKKILAMKMRLNANLNRVSTQIERDGALPDREEQFGSSHGSKALHKLDREKELADSLPCRPYQYIKRVNNRSVNASNNI